MRENKKYSIVYSNVAKSDLRRLSKSSHWEKIVGLLEALCEDPYLDPPPFERLERKLKGCISRRINVQHRLVYRVCEKENVIEIISCWTHYHG
jgi:Txe/YoeB family toxin of toxin-antitoxin system